jgi:hypothetical protein
MIKGPLRSAVLFALLSLAAGACLAAPPDLSDDFWPHPGCAVGNVQHADAEHWVKGRGFGQTNDFAEQVYTTFDDNGPAVAVRVVLNGGALSNIARIEVQDAQGNWEPVWSGRYRDALPAGCTNVWFERTLAGAPRLINAVRLGFVLEQPSMVTGGAQLLRTR